MAYVWLSLTLGGMNATQIVQSREFICRIALSDPYSYHHHDGKPGAFVDLSGFLSCTQCSNLSPFVLLCLFSHC